MATMEELADQVAHATTGKEVRGAIAEGFGQFDQVKGEVFRRVKAVEDDNSALNQRVDNLGADLSAEAQVRAEKDKELDGKITAEAQTRAEANKELEGKISQSEDRLSERITAIERILFGESPQEVKMADNSTPQLANGGAMIINLTSKEDK